MIKSNNSKWGKKIKRLNSHAFLLIFTFCTLLLNGCNNRDEALWAIGSISFLMFFLAVSLSLLMPFIHKFKLFMKFANKVKTPVKILGMILVILGLVVMSIGISFLAGDFNAQKLTFFLGIIIVVLGGSLIYWSKSDNPEKKALYAKLISISIGFMIAFLFIIKGAPGLENLID